MTLNQISIDQVLDGFQIEKELEERLPSNYARLIEEQGIDVAKQYTLIMTYAIQAGNTCPEERREDIQFPVIEKMAGVFTPETEFYQSAEELANYGFHLGVSLYETWGDEPLVVDRVKLAEEVSKKVIGFFMGPIFSRKLKGSATEVLNQVY